MYISSLQYILKTGWICPEDILKTFLQEVMKMTWRCLEDMSLRRIYSSWSRCLEDVFRKGRQQIQFNDSFDFTILVQGFTTIFHQKTQISPIILSGQNTRLWALKLQISTKFFSDVMVFKNVLINQRFPPSSISLSSEKFVNIIFYVAENKEMQTRQLAIQTFIYYLIYSGVRKSILRKEVWFVV